MVAAKLHLFERQKRFEWEGKMGLINKFFKFFSFHIEKEWFWGIKKEWSWEWSWPPDPKDKDTVSQKEEPSLVGPSPKNIPTSSFQITPLLQAIISGDLKLVQAALAEHSEQLNIAYAPNGNTPLHVAVLNGKKEIIDFLLSQQGIDQTRKNNDGKTAFDLAAKRGGTDFLH